MTKMCFEKTAKSRDSSGFLFIGVTFCIVKLNNMRNVQKASSKENLYEDRLRGKLKVIGVHLQYVNNPVGQTVEPEVDEELAKEKENLI